MIPIPAITQQMHADHFETMIYRRGRRVKWREATICSCWNHETGQPLYNCKACGGFGYIYGEPVFSVALVTNLTVEKDFYQSVGNFEYGDATLTIPKRIPKINPKTGILSLVDFDDNPMYDIGLFDLVALTDDEIKYAEVLTRNQSINGRPPDTLTQDEITRIKTVQKIDPVTGNITIYEQGVDFQLNGNTIEWISANQPADGENYSVVYFHHPTYFVFTELPKPRYQDNQFMPRSVVIRLRMGGVTKI